MPASDVLEEGCEQHPRSRRLVVSYPSSVNELKTLHKVIALF